VAALPFRDAPRSVLLSLSTRAQRSGRAKQNTQTGTPRESGSTATTTQKASTWRIRCRAGDVAGTHIWPKNLRSRRICSHPDSADTQIWLTRGLDSHANLTSAPILSLPQIWAARRWFPSWCGPRQCIGSGHSFGATSFCSQEAPQGSSPQHQMQKSRCKECWLQRPLRAPAGAESLQRLQGQQHLQAPEAEEQAQRLRLKWPLRTPEGEEQVQRLR